MARRPHYQINTIKMTEYKITIVNTRENDEEADEVIDLPAVSINGQDIKRFIEQALNYQDTIEFENGTDWIVIEPASDEGYMYYVYDKQDFLDGKDSRDGGQCTGTLSNAIEMAISGSIGI